MDKVQEVRFKKDAKEFLFFGAPLLDITELSSQETLDKYELRADDCIRETDKQETLFQRLFSNPDTYKTAGGSSQNTARIAKWILGDRGRVSFAGCVGKDNYAKTMMECLQSEGVEPVYLSLPGESTGVCACLLGIDGNRSMIARLGAAKYFAEHHLQEKSVRERLQSSHCIFVEGYFLSHSPDVLQCLANMCYENQIFSISLSAEYICKNYADILARIFPRVDILFSNEAEARVLAQSWHLEDISLVEDIARKLAVKERLPTRKPRVVVITRGPNPIIVAQGGDTILSYPVPSGVKMVDGVGCGDAMAGAFLAVYMLTSDVCQATKIGILAAVEILQVRGCHPTDKKLYPLEE